MNHTLVRIHKGLSLLITLAVLAQMFLAGLWHAEVASIEYHIFWGLGILLAALINVIVAAAGRMGKRVIVPSLILFGLILLQPILIEQRRAGIPFISAFHTLNAAFIGATASVVMRLPRAAEADETRTAVPSPTD